MTKPERKRYILDKLKTAMAAIQSDPKYAWGPPMEFFPPGTVVPENPKTAAAEGLMKAAQKFIDGKLDEAEIKPLYKQYVGLYAK